MWRFNALCHSTKRALRYLFNFAPMCLSFHFSIIFVIFPLTSGPILLVVKLETKPDLIVRGRCC